MLKDWYVMQLLQEYLMTWYHWNVKSSNDTSSPFPPPYAKLKLEKNYVVYGLGGGVGHV